MKRTAALIVLLLLSAPVRAQDRYDPQKAGHPLRIIAYALHPVGWLLDRLIFYPAWWIGGHEPLRSIVGHEGLPPGRPEPVPDPLFGNPEPANPEEQVPDAGSSGTEIIESPAPPQ